MAEKNLDIRRASAAEVADALSLERLDGLSEELGPKRWRRLSDAAQVVACYLACHPAIERVRYPGLKTDKLFEAAASTLRGGFGPIVAFSVAGEWLVWDSDERAAQEQVLGLEDYLRGARL